VTELQVLALEEILEAAKRVLAAPSRNAVRVSQDEVVTFAVLAIQQHGMIREAGLAYPRPPRPAPLPPPLFGPLDRGGAR
jgi:hypothetical protein